MFDMDDEVNKSKTGWKHRNLFKWDIFTSISRHDHAHAYYDSPSLAWYEDKCSSRHPSHMPCTFGPNREQPVLCFTCCDIRTAPSHSRAVATKPSDLQLVHSNRLKP